MNILSYGSFMVFWEAYGFCAFLFVFYYYGCPSIKLHHTSLSATLSLYYLVAMFSKLLVVLMLCCLVQPVLEEIKFGKSPKTSYQECCLAGTRARVARVTVPAQALLVRMFRILAASFIFGYF